MNLIFKICILCVFCLLPSCRSNDHPLSAGQPAPLFTLPAADGTDLELQSLYGKDILLHFWADWCTECRAEFPRLQKYYEKTNRQDFQIVCINVGQAESHVASFRDYFKLTMPMLLDRDMQVAKAYHINGLPASVLIDSKGLVRQTQIGWLDESILDKMRSTLK